MTEYQIITDHTQMRPDDLLEYRCPRFGIVTQWRNRRFIGVPVLIALPGVFLIARFLAEAMVDRIFDEDHSND